MSDNQELDQLSTKELRQLAGEHHIQNRSRLAKDELIQAIQHAIGTRSDPAPLDPSAATAAVVPDGSPTLAEAAPSAIEPALTPTSVSEAAEPEVLDAAAVADLAAPAIPSPLPAADSDAATDDNPSITAADGAGLPGDGEGERRRRRRRRRGRGRGRRSDDQDGTDRGTAGEEPAANETDEDDSGETDAVCPAIAADAPPASTVEMPATVAGQQPTADAVAAPMPAAPIAPLRRDDRPQQPPRPRLNGLQRPVASVLDRLRTFSAGVLELCDPSTPTWAQARLGELLAEIGVSAIPCAGLPHPDFHRVVGTMIASGIPAGHIVEISAPGFALRGDRGDLFPLRRADVRVAGERDERLESTLAASRTWSLPTTSAVGQPAATSVVAVESPATQLPTTPPATEAPPIRDEQRQDRHEDRRGRHRGQERRHAEPRSDDSEPTALIEAPRPPVPSPGRQPETPHHREPPADAPALPLAPRVADELSQLAKAEGFRHLGLNDQILADLAAMGWQKPSPIQAASIPVALQGRDVVGQAQTGTGKTGAFVLPILQRLYSLEGEGPAALVLCPTRELARQVHQEFMRMSGASGARAALIYGGVSMDEQFRSLSRKPHVVIGTPGRIIDHMKRRTLDLSRLSIAVLDEADQMLDIGFWPDVMYIIGHTPPSRQMMLFSATFPDPIREMAEKHMREPERVHIEPERVTVDQVDQKFIAVPREKKNELLAHFIETFNPPQLVVFCKTKHQTDRVAEVLKRKNMSAGAIHGDLPQSKRERTLQTFRSGELQCLVATNVAARGLDIPSVSHVVNYDVPEMPEEYVHRIGRTARNGAKGVARTFITPDDGQFLLEIEKHIGLLLEEETVAGFEPPPPAKPAPLAPPADGPRLLKPLIGGIRLGRRR